MIALALLSMVVGLSGAMVPGQMFIVTVQQASLGVWLAGLWIVVGHMVAEASLVAMLRAGIGRFLKLRGVTTAISVIGGLAMLYFAWEMLVVVRGDLSHTGKAAGMLSPLGLIWRGILLSVLNPYWLLWWATIGIAFINSHVQESGGRAWYAFFTGHILADYLWYLLVSVLVAFGGSFLDARLHALLILICAGGLAVLGVLFLLRPLLERRRTVEAGQA